MTDIIDQILKSITLPPVQRAELSRSLRAVRDDENENDSELDVSDIEKVIKKIGGLTEAQRVQVLYALLRHKIDGGDLSMTAADQSGATRQTLTPLQAAAAHPNHPALVRSVTKSVQKTRVQSEARQKSRPI